MVDEMISRRAAIDLFPDDDLEYDTKGGYIAPHLARQMICELPFAQPDHVADVSKKVDVDDCISRRAVKEKLEQNLIYMRAFGVDRCLGLIDELPAVKSEPKWVPCSERLPEENGQYLITIKYKHVNDSYEDVYAEHGEWLDGEWDMFCFGHCGEVEDIIAWLPLPEPYREERDGDK